MKLPDGIYKRLVLLNAALLFSLLLVGLLLLGTFRDEVESNVVNPFKAYLKMQFFQSKAMAKAFRGRFRPEGAAEIPIYHIKIQESDLRDIQLMVDRMLKEAPFRDGVSKWALMTDENKKWYRCRFQADGVEYPAKIRIRGDLENHWAYGKKSWRIKFDKEKLFHGYRELNIVLPGDKGYATQQVAHDLGRESGLLVPDSGYSRVRLNGVDMGLYFWFENNSGEMLEKLRYPEGEIFRENNTWVQTNYTAKGLPLPFLNVHAGSYTASIHEDSVLGFYSARWNRLLKLVRGEIGAHVEQESENLIDMEKYAKWNAITWFLGSTHSHWGDNLRWYYDSTTGLFEPLLYDLQTEEIEAEKGTFEAGSDDPLARRLLRIPRFQQMRNEALWKLVSQPANAFGPRADTYYAKIRPYLFTGIDANLEAGDLDRRMAKIRELSASNSALLREMLAFSRVFLTPSIQQRDGKNILEVGVVPDSLADLKLDRLQLTFSEDAGEMPVNVSFVSGQEITPLKPAAVNVKGGLVTLEFDDVLWHMPRDETLRPSAAQSFLRFEFPSIPQTKWVTPGFLKTIDWSFANSVTREPLEPQYVRQSPVAYDWQEETWQEAFRTPEEFVSSSGLPFEVNGRTLILRKGEYKVARNLIVPSTCDLQLEAGVTLQMAPGVSLLTYRALTVNGEEGNPVRVVPLNEGKAWGSLAVVRAGGVSRVRHLIVSGGSESHLNGIFLSGQLCFYSSEVELSHCVIENAQADDALNVKRAPISVRETRFRNNSSDAFDGDWVRGEVKNCVFEANGGDGLDLSGSAVTVENTLFAGMKDKGMSVGERSTLYGLNNVIRDSVIGVASKDMSQVFLYASVLYGNRTGVSLYRKKPIFGGAQAYLAGCLVWKNQTDFELDAESDLELVGVGLREWAPKPGIKTKDLRVGDPDRHYIKRGRSFFSYNAATGGGAVFARGPSEVLKPAADFSVSSLADHPVGLLSPESIHE